MYFQKKPEILKGRGGSRLWNSEGMGGSAFWNFRRQGGVKTWKPSVVGYGYFLELPNFLCPQGLEEIPHTHSNKFLLTLRCLRV